MSHCLWSRGIVKLPLNAFDALGASQCSDVTADMKVTSLPITLPAQEKRNGPVVFFFGFTHVPYLSSEWATLQRGTKSGGTKNPECLKKDIKVHTKIIPLKLFEDKRPRQRIANQQFYLWTYLLSTALGTSFWSVNEDDVFLFFIWSPETKYLFCFLIIVIQSFRTTLYCVVC